MSENEKNNSFSERLKCIEKRVDDTKNFMNVVITALGIIFVVFVVFAGITLKQERDTLHRLKDDTEKRINELIGLSKKEPELICTTITGLPLEGSTINGTLNESKVTYHYMIKNIGNGETTNLKSQMYSKEPLVIANTKGSDEVLFDYVSIPLSLFYEERKFVLPPGYAIVLDGEFTIVSDKEKAKGIHPMLVKIYYGKDKPLKISFNIVIE